MKEGRIGMGLGRVSVMREGAQGREGREGRADLSVAMLHVQLALLPHAILNIRYLHHLNSQLYEQIRLVIVFPFFPLVYFFLFFILFIYLFIFFIFGVFIFLYVLWEKKLVTDYVFHPRKSMVIQGRKKPWFYLDGTYLVNFLTNKNKLFEFSFFKIDCF